MGILYERKYYWDRQLQLRCMLAYHSHGYYYLYFPNNNSDFEPDLIIAERFINFEERFESLTEEQWESRYSKMDHVRRCRNCGTPITVNRRD